MENLKYVDLSSSLKTLIPVSGKHLTSPKSKLPPPMQSFHEEPSPKMRSLSKMINGQSTESLESLSDELASNSGGATTNSQDAASRRVSRSHHQPHPLNLPH